MGCFTGFIYLMYAYSFFLGSIWIEKQYYNHALKRNYQAGDVMSCFFGAIFGMFSLGMITPNIKAIEEGKVAGKAVFDIIEREPAIN